MTGSGGSSWGRSRSSRSTGGGSSSTSSHASRRSAPRTWRTLPRPPAAVPSDAPSSSPPSSQRPLHHTTAPPEFALSFRPMGVATSTAKEALEAAHRLNFGNDWYADDMTHQEQLDKMDREMEWTMEHTVFKNSPTAAKPSVAKPPSHHRMAAATRSRSNTSGSASSFHHSLALSEMDSVGLGTTGGTADGWDDDDQSKHTAASGYSKHTAASGYSKHTSASTGAHSQYYTPSVTSAAPTVQRSNRSYQRPLFAQKIPLRRLRPKTAGVQPFVPFVPPQPLVTTETSVTVTTVTHSVAVHTPMPIRNDVIPSRNPEDDAGTTIPTTIMPTTTRSTRRPLPVEKAAELDDGDIPIHSKAKATSKSVVSMMSSSSSLPATSNGMPASSHESSMALPRPYHDETVEPHATRPRRCWTAWETWRPCHRAANDDSDTVPRTRRIVACTSGSVAVVGIVVGLVIVL